MVTINLPPMDDNQQYWYLCDDEAAFYRVDVHGNMEELGSDLAATYDDVEFYVHNETDH